MRSFLLPALRVLVAILLFQAVPDAYAAADFVVVKTNSVGGSTPLTSPTWTWTWQITNAGDAAATVPGGAYEFLNDWLPNTGISYGTPSVSRNAKVTGSMPACSISAQHVLLCDANGATFEAGGTVTVTVVATAMFATSYVNPRVANLCTVNPYMDVGEANTSNNKCSDTVTVTSPEADLTVTKTNNVNGQSQSGGSWTWTLLVTNSAGAADSASFSDGQTILTDNLPNTSISYGTPAVTTGGGTAGTVVCTVVNADLQCKASGAVTIPPSGTVSVAVPATASAERVHANPRSGGVCAVDPDSLIGETAETNNSCADTVTTQTADMRAVKTNSVGGAAALTSPTWNWIVTLENIGTLNKSYSGELFVDHLPNTDISYGTPSVSLNANVTGSMTCAITSFNLSCQGTNVVFSPGGAATITIPATAAASGSYGNPRSGGACYLDNDFYGSPSEPNTSNNVCSDTVTVVAPAADLTIAKTNDAGGQSSSGGSWNWTLVASNSSGAGAPATFSNGQTILSDSLPDSGITYGLPGVTTGSGTTGTIVCSIGSFNLSCVASGTVSIPPAGTVTVVVPATAGTETVYGNPRSGGVCSVDPGNVIAESTEGNNSCSDSVTTRTLDLVVTKTNDVGGSVELTAPAWTWTITIRNAGTLAASFGQNKPIFFDDLPNANISYGTPSVSLSGVTGSVDCAISNFQLTCNSGDSLTFDGGGIVTITVAATATAAGTYVNPRAGGSCAVDLFYAAPGETHPDSANNHCADTVSVIVPSPDLTVTKTNDAGGQSYAGGSWTWSIVVANNSGAATAAFTNGQTILTDDLPNTGVSYGSPAAALGGGSSGVVNCAIVSASLACTASGTVSIPAGGTITVDLPTTATAEKVYANPREGGTCKADPQLSIAETNEDNNTCSDSVSTQTADMIVVKTNDVGHSVLITSPNWTWTLQVQNIGTFAKTFTGGTQVLVDNLPDNVTYGAPNVSVNGSVSGGTLTCSINASSNLVCNASGTVVFDPGGVVTITVTASASAAGTYSNPRPGGVCTVRGALGSPQDVNQSNDSCADAVTVALPSTTTALSSSANPSTVGQSVTFTATTVSGSAGTITGTVTFKNGSATIGTGTLAGGKATFTTSALAEGVHSITAAYGGSASYAASTSSPVTQTVNLASFGAPGNFIAAATSGSTVALSWSPVAGAVSYRIYRSSLNSAFSLLTTITQTTHTDTGLAASRTYLYKVQAVSGTAASSYTKIEPATTVVFTDPSLSGLTAKAVHLTQLRTAVNAMRAAAGLTAATFTDSSLAAGTTIKVVHITELRTALDAARARIGIATLAYTNSTLTAGMWIRAAHVLELRAGTQ